MSFFVRVSLFIYNITRLKKPLVLPDLTNDSDVHATNIIFLISSTTPLLSHEIVTLPRVKSMASAWASRHAKASKQAGSITPGNTIDEDPRNLPSSSLQTAAEAPVAPSRDSPPSTLILTIPATGGFHLWGCLASATRIVLFETFFYCLQLWYEPLHKEMSGMWALEVWFMDRLPPGYQNRTAMRCK